MASSSIISHFEEIPEKHFFEIIYIITLGVNESKAHCLYGAATAKSA
jgi:hypothetical protein